MKYNRDEVIEALIDYMVDVVTKWALTDIDSLREYVANCESFDKLDDDCLMDNAINQLNWKFDDDEEVSS